jgi:hypothetical protein
LFRYLAKRRRASIDIKIVFIANCGIKDEIVNCIKNAGKRYDVPVVELADIDKIDGHPTPLGMSQIAEQIEKAFV